MDQESALRARFNSESVSPVKAASSREGPSAYCVMIDDSIWLIMIALLSLLSMNGLGVSISYYGTLREAMITCDVWYITPPSDSMSHPCIGKECRSQVNEVCDQGEKAVGSAHEKSIAN